MSTTLLDPTQLDWAMTDAGHREVDGSAEPMPASAAYTPITPTTIIPRLRAEFGYRALTVRQGRFTGPRQCVVSVDMGRCIGYRTVGYQRQVHILLDHAGKAAVRLRAGVLRAVCANEFTAPALRLHHCSQAAALFARHPASVVRGIADEAYAVADRLESYRGRGDGEWLARAFRHYRPRLAKNPNYRDALRRYSVQDGTSVWAVAQALTDTLARGTRGKSRYHTELASRILRLPDAVLLGKAPVVPDLFDRADWN